MPTNKLRQALIGAFKATLLTPITLTFFLGSTGALALEPVGIYEDHLSDAPYTDKKPVRIRLKRSPDVKLGRMGGVWGSLGGSDEADSFFVGKTPDLTNLQITTNTPAGRSPVSFVFTGKDGQDVKTVRLESVPGESATQWIALKGKISVDVLANSNDATNYALYIWYPGGSVDSLNEAEIAEISSGDFAEKPVIFGTKRSK